MRKRVFGLIMVFALMNLSTVYAQTYKLIWEDNFEGTTLDSTKWNYEQKVGVWNTGANAELQHYKKENVTVGDDGSGNSCLILSAKKESYNGYSYTSGKVTTKGKFAFKRGKLEAFIKIPNLANGLWPAFWTLGYTPIGWPDCGEIDVLEMGHKQGITDGVQNSYIGAHLFWGPYPRDYGTEFVATEDLSTGYFKHTLIWDESTISVYFNDASTPYFSMGISGDDTEEYRNFQNYLIFNMAVGGSLPGINTVDGISATMPANMYIDWVKVYQEEGKEDYNASLSPFGTFGIYEDVQHTDMSMNLGFDLTEEVSGLTPIAGETPYEGDNVFAYNVASGSAYELKLKAELNRNMENYKNGSIQLMIKTTVTDDIQMGISDNSGVEKMVTFSDANGNNFTRDGSWQSVFVVLSDISEGLNIESIKHMFIVKGTASADASISIDQIIFKETVPASGYYGIVTDNTAITDGFVVDNTVTNMYIWSNTVAFNEFYPAYEGENVLSFKSTGAEAWFGFGFHSSNALNFVAYADGYLNISIRTKSNGAFYIGMDGEDSDAAIDFDGSNDPYGFERDGEWHHLIIPMADLTAKGLNLASINHVFKTGGGGSIGDIAYDDIYLSEGVSNIENSMVCYAKSIQISPSNGTTSVGKSIKLIANVINQFDKKYDSNVEWSANGGVIDEEGEFSSDAIGEFEITAKQDNASATGTVTVTEATSAKNFDEEALHAYMNTTEQQIHISGLKSADNVLVYNASGKAIYTSVSSATEWQIDMSNQQSGVYIIRVISSGNNYTRKVVKQ